MRHSKYIGQLKYSSTKYSVISILLWKVSPLPVPRWMTTWRQLHPHITWFVLQVSSNLLYNVTFLPYATLIYFDIYLPVTSWTKLQFFIRVSQQKRVKSKSILMICSILQRLFQSKALSDYVFFSQFCVFKH